MLNIVKWRCKRGYIGCRCHFINPCMYVFWNVKECKKNVNDGK